MTDPSVANDPAHPTADGRGESARDQALDALRELIIAGEKYRLAGTDYFHVSTSESLAISYLSARGDLGQTDLARNLGLTTSSTTSLVDRLVQHGYVERRSHPEDRRRAIVHLTDQGASAMAQSRSWLRHALDHVPEDRLDEVTATLAEIAAQLRGSIELIPLPSTAEAPVPSRTDDPAH